MNPVDFELGDFWYWLAAGDRRVLCAAANVDAANVALRWSDISTENRVAIIRGMNGLAQLALDCSVALHSARENLNKHSGARRDEEDHDRG